VLPPAEQHRKLGPARPAVGVDLVEQNHPRTASDTSGADELAEFRVRQAAVQHLTCEEQQVGRVLLEVLASQCDPAAVNLRATGCAPHQLDVPGPFLVRPDEVAAAACAARGLRSATKRWHGPALPVDLPPMPIALLDVLRVLRSVAEERPYTEGATSPLHQHLVELLDVVEGSLELVAKKLGPRVDREGSYPSVSGVILSKQRERREVERPCLPASRSSADDPSRMTSLGRQRQGSLPWLGPGTQRASEA
jgi:hypothetical protein